MSAYPFFVRFGILLSGFYVIILAAMGLLVTFDVLTSGEMWMYAQRIGIAALITFVAGTVLSFLFSSQSKQ